MVGEADKMRQELQNAKFSCCESGTWETTLPWRTAVEIELRWTRSVICFKFRVVSTTSKTAGTNNLAKSESLPFEEALKKLQAIVEAMEAEDLPLEGLLAKYEEGTRLARICQEKLAEAEVKIQRLEKHAAGDLQLRPVPPPAERSDA